MDIQNSKFLKIYASLYQIRQLPLIVHDICFLSGTVKASIAWVNQSTALNGLLRSVWQTLDDMHVYVRDWKYVTMTYADSLSWFNKVSSASTFSSGTPATHQAGGSWVQYTRHHVKVSEVKKHAVYLSYCLHCYTSDKYRWRATIYPCHFKICVHNIPTYFTS